MSQLLLRPNWNVTKTGHGGKVICCHGDGSAQIVINKTVRTKEALAIGDEIHMKIIPR